MLTYGSAYKNTSSAKLDWTLQTQNTCVCVFLSVCLFWNNFGDIMQIFGVEHLALGLALCPGEAGWPSSISSDPICYLLWLIHCEEVGQYPRM